MLTVVACAVAGGLWRRWLGAADTGPRSVKMVAGLILFMAATNPAWISMSPFNWQNLAVILISGGLTLAMWAEGHGQGIDVGTAMGTAESDLRYMAARYAAVVVPAAGAALGVTGGYIPFLIAVPVGMLVGSMWYVCSKLKLGHYTAYAEAAAGAIAFGASASFFI